MDEDDADEDEDEEDHHGSSNVEFGTIDDLRKALQDRQSALSKTLSGIRTRISEVQIGMPKMIAFGGSPSSMMSRRPKMAADDDGEEVRFHAARLTALLDGLVDAAKQKRAEPESKTSLKAADPDERDAKSQPATPANATDVRSTRATMARMLGGWAASLSSQEPRLQLQFQPAPPPMPSSESAAPSQRTIIHIPDLKDIYRSDLGARILHSLTRVVQKRRRSGESMIIVGTTGYEPNYPFISAPQDTADYPFRNISVPPLFNNALESFFIHSVEDRVKPEAPMPPTSSKPVLAQVDRRILNINLRHIARMMTRLRPDDAPLDHDALALIQSALRVTDRLHRRVLSLDQVQRLVLTAVGLAETHAQSAVVQPVHVAMAATVTGKADQVVAMWVTHDRMSKMPKAIGSGAKGKEGSEGGEDVGRNRMEEIKGSCNAHETRLLTGVIDAKNIKTGFADVHAPPETIEALKTLTSLSLLRPEAFSYGVLANDRLPGLLLYGPPGTGKTMLAKAVAKESRATVLEITGAQIYEKYVGEGEKMVRAAFSLAKKLSPCVVFIDEADAIFGSRSSGGGNRNTHREIINQFLREWDGMDDHGVFIMVASNRPFDLDDAVLRRLPRRLLVDLPVAKDRESILGIHLKHELLDPSVALGQLAEQTPLYSGSDLKNLCVSAALACVREENELAVAKKEEGLPAAGEADLDAEAL
ncbi:hypothetical protein LTR53_005894 [Teratosphaeriaceae sp. CCFEE 6253]|nr:hypothetical protein LTR53_005894 [Teratosphaeriaceae sp. CCFEE 6253]